ncbi:MAG TPA: bifunctional glutamine-synthetase adenylyltransferase/deadenyltransferase, partial [Acidimicrobiia bacterium]|nr:bifunctional glutamine-synthetase adenylyltransferase/deadenyltransferase [Acidimicrobiia bacterium]
MAQTLLSPALSSSVERSADPATARAFLTRLLQDHPDVAADVATNPIVRDALVALSAASRSLSSAVARDPSLLDPLRDGDSLGRELELSDYRTGSAGFLGAADDGPGALRRWKQRELLRIAARDLLGVADLPAVGRELAALASVCLECAVQLVAPEVPLAIIAMGKLGGQELNYASDVDVLFVHEGESSTAERAARAVLTTMSGPTADGIVFRTDADLRPEGRSGSLSRTLEAYAAYYERWAQPWEFQALLKARPVAGDADLGRRFAELVDPFVWPEVLDPDAVRSVRAMKARAEGEMHRRGLTDREVKRGRGGIRDIEFAVQLLQLVHGRHDASVRSPTTLDALAQLATGGYIERDDAAQLGDAYRFLRTVEHRLQLQDEQQTHTLPTDVGARTRLARVLGFRDRGGHTALDLFEAEHRACQNRVRSIYERLFFAPLLDTLAGAGPLTPEAVEQRLAAFGFLDVARTRAALQELTQGLTRRSRVMQQLLPVILSWLSATPDPDLGLLQLRRLAEGEARSASLARTFRESPRAAERACRLLGSSRLLGDALRRQPDFVEALGDDETLAREKSRDELVDEALGNLTWRAGVAERRVGLRRFKRREVLRIAARDLLGFASIETTERELASLADACVEAALRALEPTLPFAVMGMGRFGGAELSYASDLDVLFVYDGEDAADFGSAETIAEHLLIELGGI